MAGISQITYLRCDCGAVWVWCRAGAVQCVVQRSVVQRSAPCTMYLCPSVPQGESQKEMHHSKILAPPPRYGSVTAICIDRSLVCHFSLRLPLRPSDAPPHTSVVRCFCRPSFFSSVVSRLFSACLPCRTNESIHAPTSLGLFSFDYRCPRPQLSSIQTHDSLLRLA